MTTIRESNPSSSTALGPLPEDHLVPVKDLTKIFPDIQGELCSRHSSLLGKLKNTFNKLYDGFEPSYYIIVKGNTHIIGTEDDQVELSMGLENGIIILVTKTYQKNNIFINGNHIDQELILDSQGKVQQGLYQLSTEIQKICESAISDISINKLFGGIIYVHANIPEGFYNYKNSLLTALFLSMLIINDHLSTYTIGQIINKLTQTKLIQPLFLEKEFYDYQNRQFSLMVGSTLYKLPLDKKIKFLFCRLDLALCDLRHSQSNIKQIKEDKDKIIEWMSKNYGIKSFYQAFQNQLQVNIQKLTIPGADEDSRLQYMKLIQGQLKQLKALCEFSNNQMTIQDLITFKWLIDSKIRMIFSEEVVDLVQTIKQRTKIQACTVVEGEYLMMVVDRRKYTEVICVLRQLLHKGQLKSKSFFKIQEELVEHRWDSDSEIGQKIFASVPSKGIAIFDPSQAIWFD